MAATPAKLDTPFTSGSLGGMSGGSSGPSPKAGGKAPKKVSGGKMKGGKY
jgi:hypothetical protein